MGFFRQEYWNGLPFASLGDLPNPGIKLEYPVSPALQADSLPDESFGGSKKTPEYFLSLLKEMEEPKNI